ncbi:MAG: type-F conjugative transfer system pilin assembly protein TrbC [Gammaproteobacteria bacterium]
MLRILIVAMSLFCGFSYSECMNQVSEEQKPESPLIILVSSAMPELSLKAWALQAEKTQSKLVIRGFLNNSFQDTYHFIQNFLTKNNLNVEFSIDPEIFSDYKVSVVPAVLLRDSNEYALVSGDIGLEEALIKLNHTQSKHLKNLIRKYLDALRKT